MTIDIDFDFLKGNKPFKSHISYTSCILSLGRNLVRRQPFDLTHIPSPQNNAETYSTPRLSLEWVIHPPLRQPAE